MFFLFCLSLFSYVSEISEPSVRGVMCTIALMSYNFGILIVLGCGLVLPWRTVAFSNFSYIQNHWIKYDIISFYFSLRCVPTQLPICCAIRKFTSNVEPEWRQRVFFFKKQVCKAVCLQSKIVYLQVPESPSWLLLRDRAKDAEKSLQWLRGWTSKEMINKEFIDLQNYSCASTACLACAKQSIKCEHPKPTFRDKLNDLKRKRTLKPMFLVFCLYFCLEFCIVTVWQPYIIQVLKAFGTPINANVATVISAGLGIFASLFLISTVKKLGRRRLYLTSSFIVTICTFGLS